MNTFKKWNPNPVGNRTQDCAQRAIAAALDVDWDTASDLIYEMAKAMGVDPAKLCREHPRGVFVLKTSGHVVTVIDGQAWDTWDSTGEIPQYYWYRRYE